MAPLNKLRFSLVLGKFHIQKVLISLTVALVLLVLIYSNIQVCTEMGISVATTLYNYCVFVCFGRILDYYDVSLDTTYSYTTYSTVQKVADTNNQI